MLGILTGLHQEAALIRSIFPQTPLALSGASEEGAMKALEKLRHAGVTRIVSFGCAGGLSPSVQPGSVIVADYVHVGGVNYATDSQLSEACGRTKALQGGILHSNQLMSRAEQKHYMYQDTGCLAVDMESGVAACSGLPFAVLRVVCDDAGRDLPPAAGEAMKEGRVHVPALFRSLVRHPGQIPALISLGRDAAKARKTMAIFLQDHQERLRTIG